MKMAELMGLFGKNRCHSEADRLLPIGDDPADHHCLGKHCFGICEQAREIPLRGTEQCTRHQDLSRDHLTDRPENLMPHVWLQAIDGEDHPTLLFEELLQALLLMQMHRHQFFVAMQSMFYCSFTDLHTSPFQVLMDFFD